MAVWVERILQERNLQHSRAAETSLECECTCLGQIAWASSLPEPGLWWRARNFCRKAGSCGSGFSGSRRGSPEFQGEESSQHPSFLQMVMAQVSIFRWPLRGQASQSLYPFLLIGIGMTPRRHRFPLLSKPEAPELGKRHPDRGSQCVCSAKSLLPPFFGNTSLG